jgi:hypothetical protein
MERDDIEKNETWLPPSVPRQSKFLFVFPPGFGVSPPRFPEQCWDIWKRPRLRAPQNEFHAWWTSNEIYPREESPYRWSSLEGDQTCDDLK